MTAYHIKIREGGKESDKDSQTSTFNFAQVNIGPSILPIKETAGRLDVSTQALKIADALLADEPASKGQLTTTQNQVDDHETRLGTAETDINNLQSDLTTEITNRGNADTTLQTNITNEATVRGNADTALQGLIDGHETRLDTAETDINNLQVDLAAILANTPKTQSFVADPGGQSVFNATAPGLTWDALDSVHDIEVMVDGKWQVPVTNWVKSSTTQITLSSPANEGSTVVIWKQGTSSGSGGGGGQGLTQGNPADQFYLLDQGDMTTVWKLSVVNGALDLTSV